MSPLSIILLFAVKKSSSVKQERHVHITSEDSPNDSEQICWWILIWEDNGEWTFSLKEALLLWIYIVASRNGLKLKCLNDSFVSYKHSFPLHKMLIDGLESYGLLVEYCDAFISCLYSHSDGTHSPNRIHWWASDIMLHFSKSVPKKKLILDGLQCYFLRVTGNHNWDK